MAPFQKKSKTKKKTKKFKKHKQVSMVPIEPRTSETDWWDSFWHKNSTVPGISPFLITSKFQTLMIYHSCCSGRKPFHACVSLLTLSIVVGEEMMGVLPMDFLPTPHCLGQWYHFHLFCFWVVLWIWLIWFWKKKMIFMDMIDANLQDILYLVMRQKGLSISSGCQRLLLNTYVPLWGRISYQGLHQDSST